MLRPGRACRPHPSGNAAQYKSPFNRPGQSTGPVPARHRPVPARFQASRAPFGHALEELARERADIVGLSADLSKYTDLHIFAAAHPERFYQMGMAEQVMIPTLRVWRAKASRRSPPSMPYSQQSAERRAQGAEQSLWRCQTACPARRYPPCRAYRSAAQALTVPRPPRRSARRWPVRRPMRRANAAGKRSSALGTSMSSAIFAISDATLEKGLSSRP